MVQTVTETRPNRRRTYAAMAGAVVAVLAVGGIVVAIAAGRGHSHAAAGGAPAPASCPSAPPSLAAPAASSGTLFPADVTAMRLCLYDLNRMITSKVLDGPTAADYARRFNALPPAGRAMACPLYLTQRTIVFQPAGPDGPGPTVVGKVGGCGTTSNGTVMRHAAQLLAEMQIVMGVSSPPVPGGSGHNVPGPGPS